MANQKKSNGSKKSGNGGSARRSTIGGQGFDVADAAALDKAIDAMFARVVKVSEALPKRSEFDRYLLKLGFNRALTLEKARAKG